MPTAEELLANAIGDAGDNILTVDLNARVINIPKGITNIGVMSDDDVLRLNFSMPRYYGEYDLSEFQMQINYLNAKKYGDVYKIEDAVVDTNTITFSWLVGRYAVTYVGEIRFNLCFKKYDKTLSIKESLSDVKELLKEEGVKERFSSEETKVIESVLSLITSRLKGEANEED